MSAGILELEDSRAKNSFPVLIVCFVFPLISLFLWLFLRSSACGAHYGRVVLNNKFRPALQEKSWTSGRTEIQKAGEFYQAKIKRVPRVLPRHARNRYLAESTSRSIFSSFASSVSSAYFGLSTSGKCWKMPFMMTSACGGHPGRCFPDSAWCC